MKKLTALLIIVVIVINFSSCKKGENDPLIPFGTRDALITNTWKLTNLSKTITTVNELGSSDKRTFSFDGTTMIEKHTNIFGVSTEDSYSYSDNIEILKDNTYNKVIEKGNAKTETKAFWYWHNSNKNKIGINFNNGIIYYITKLSRKELILEYSEYTIYTDEDGDKTTSTNNEMLTYSAE